MDQSGSCRATNSRLDRVRVLTRPSSRLLLFRHSYNWVPWQLGSPCRRTERQPSNLKRHHGSNATVGRRMPGHRGDLSPVAQKSSLTPQVAVAPQGKRHAKRPGFRPAVQSEPGAPSSPCRAKRVCRTCGNAPPHRTAPRAASSGSADPAHSPDRRHCPAPVHLGERPSINRAWVVVSPIPQPEAKIMKPDFGSSPLIWACAVP